MRKYLVVIRYGRKLYDVELIGSTPERAANRAKVSIQVAKRDFFTRCEVISVEEVG